ncbi:hypothetical protein MML48_6g00001696 [Holotrichia oblita]|uniref:Uncharacterized protein n=1 Tax=Holotrichia oblita TaxID=644536 RepID=A0ACB9SX61_HOLOL|nr:hypothetical protein MML48_6g00001696 [Holotrichia oblita]
METVEENHNNDVAINKKENTHKNETLHVRNFEQEMPQNNILYTGNLNRQYEDHSRDVKVTALENVEEPMDLTFSQTKIKTELENVYNVQKKQLSHEHVTDAIQQDNSMPIVKLIQAEEVRAPTPAKKRGRKKKELTIEINNGSSCTPPYDNPEYMQIDSRQGEVLMAAKSLFSKRTRTLYHWMYPNAPKAQLKSAVSMSWETLGVQEKEFYISQVLGRFGFPQSSLMINPQLGGLRGVSVQPPLDLSAPAHINLETHTAVSTILEDREKSNEAGTSWPQYNMYNVKKTHKKRGRIGRPPGTKSQKAKENVKSVAVEAIHDDFPNDPELRKEFEQFKWTLHMIDK